MDDSKRIALIEKVIRIRKKLLLQVQFVYQNHFMKLLHQQIHIQHHILQQFDKQIASIRNIIMESISHKPLIYARQLNRERTQVLEQMASVYENRIMKLWQQQIHIKIYIQKQCDKQIASLHNIMIARKLRKSR